MRRHQLNPKEQRELFRWDGLFGRVLPRLVGVMFFSGIVAVTSTPAASSSPPPLATNFRLAEFGTEEPSSDVRHLADWIAATRDNGPSDFLIVDKRYARVYVFDATTRLKGSTPVLLGAARGDASVPGIGSRPIADIRPNERTTPAGRFTAERGRNLQGEDIVWVDYDAAVSMHRVRATNPSERRLERLATPTIDDNRISYGCINVPVKFYETHVRPTVAKQPAVVYVLPEVKSVREVFGSYDVRGERRHTALKAR